MSDATGNDLPVNIASQVVENLPGALNSRFTVNDPILLPCGLGYVYG